MGKSYIPYPYVCETGRGTPSIDSLKAIAEFFSVTIDELLSGEKLISIAEKENKLSIERMCHLLFGAVDICWLLLAVLPLYPNETEGYVYSVSLFDYTQTTALNLAVCWALFSALVIMGVTNIVLTKLKLRNAVRILTEVSLGLNLAAVLFLVVTREAYAATLAILFLIIKGMLLVKRIKT